MKQTNIFKEFFSSKKSEGIVLVIATCISLLLANIFKEQYTHLWHISIGGMAIEHWVNDGLMTIFFLLVGLELEREIYIGELSAPRNALLPIVAALGGILFPAGIHLLLNYGSATQSGAGIPMATDIAFSLGILSLLGNRVPVSLKIFLTALAIADDLGAIIVIAIFYTDTLQWSYLISSLALLLLLYVLGKMKIYTLWVYIIGGIGAWFLMLHSGVHATLSGVLLAFAIPFEGKNSHSMSGDIQHRLHIPVAFGILPLFALANTGIILSENWTHSLFEPNSIGIFLGLVLGKPLGVIGFSFLLISSGICTLPEGVSWKHLIGAGILAGIGFTMSIFVTLLAFEQEALVKSSQIVVLLSSVCAAIVGYFWFVLCIKPLQKNEI